jgi:hypothetical protein
MPPRAALSLVGPLAVGAGATLSGVDSEPDGWRCEPVGKPVPAVLLPLADSVAGLEIGCPEAGCLQGDPAVSVDSAAIESQTAVVSPVELDRLRRLATVVIAESTIRPEPTWTNETCVTARRDNWGDPYPLETPCRGYFPLVFVGGDLEIRGGRGQGVLVVDGDLMLTGGFTYAGFVLVSGQLMTEGVGNRIDGAVVVANRQRGPSWLGDGTSIHYSGCGLRRAALGAGQPKLLPGRSWLQAY